MGIIFFGGREEMGEAVSSALDLMCGAELLLTGCPVSLSELMCTHTHTHTHTPAVCVGQCPPGADGEESERVWRPVAVFALA